MKRIITILVALMLLSACSSEHTPPTEDVMQVPTNALTQIPETPRTTATENATPTAVHPTESVVVDIMPDSFYNPETGETIALGISKADLETILDITDASEQSAQSDNFYIEYDDGVASYIQNFGDKKWLAVAMVTVGDAKQKVIDALGEPVLSASDGDAVYMYDSLGIPTNNYGTPTVNLMILYKSGAVSSIAISRVRSV